MESRQFGLRMFEPLQHRPPVGCKVSAGPGTQLPLLGGLLPLVRAGLALRTKTGRALGPELLSSSASFTLSCSDFYRGSYSSHPSHWPIGRVPPEFSASLHPVQPSAAWGLLLPLPHPACPLQAQPFSGTHSPSHHPSPSPMCSQPPPLFPPVFGPPRFICSSFVLIYHVPYQTESQLFASWGP